MHTPSGFYRQAINLSMERPAPLLLCAGLMEGSPGLTWLGPEQCEEPKGNWQLTRYLDKKNRDWSGGKHFPSAPGGSVPQFPTLILGGLWQTQSNKSVFQ